MGIASDRVVAILLAGGRATRFGADKLAHPFRGRPLAEHAAATLASIGFARRIAVVGPSMIDLTPFGFERVSAPLNAPMSASLKTGIAIADELDCDACLFALADMPVVPRAHLEALLDTHDGDLTATLSGDRRMAPAVIGRARFAAIASLDGDRGARDLLRNVASVPAQAEWLIDIDTPVDVASNEAPPSGQAR